MIANEESLDALLAVKSRIGAYLLPDERNDQRACALIWQDVLWAIWGKDSRNGGSKVIKAAPKELREKYQQIFA